VTRQWCLLFLSLFSFSHARPPALARGAAPRTRASGTGAFARRRCPVRAAQGERGGETREEDENKEHTVESGKRMSGDAVWIPHAGITASF